MPPIAKSRLPQVFQTREEAPALVKLWPLRVLKCELLRELGQFESAKLALARVTSARYTEAVRQQSALCDAGDTQVRKL